MRLYPAGMIEKLPTPCLVMAAYIYKRNVCNWANSVEKVCLPERREISFQNIASAWNLESLVNPTGFNSFS